MLSMFIALSREGVENTIKTESLALGLVESFVFAIRNIPGGTFSALRSLLCPSAWLHVEPGCQEQGVGRDTGWWWVVVMPPQVKDFCGT